MPNDADAMSGDMRPVHARYRFRINVPRLTPLVPNDGAYSVLFSAAAHAHVVRIVSEAVHDLYRDGGTDDLETYLHDRFWRDLWHLEDSEQISESEMTELSREFWTVFDLVYHYSNLSHGVVQSMMFHGNQFETLLSMRYNNLCSNEDSDGVVFASVSAQG